MIRSLCRCGSQFGSKLYQLIQELGKEIIDDGADDRPVSILIVMDQPVSQTGDFYPRNGAVLVLNSGDRLATCSPILYKGVVIAH